MGGDFPWTGGFSCNGTDTQSGNIYRVEPTKRSAEFRSAFPAERCVRKLETEFRATAKHPTFNSRLSTGRRSCGAR